MPESLTTMNKSAKQIQLMLQRKKQGKKSKKTHVFEETITANIFQTSNTPDNCGPISSIAPAMPTSPANPGMM